jgi:hypothetical protein
MRRIPDHPLFPRPDARRSSGLVGLLVGAGLAIAATWSHAATPLKFDSERTHELAVSRIGGEEYEFTTLGVDPWIELEPIDAATVPADDSVLAFEYFCPEGLDGLEIFYGTPFSETRRCAAGGLPRAESWLPAAVDLQLSSDGRWTRDHERLRLDFGCRRGITLRVRDLRLREPTTAERRSQGERAAERRDKLGREARVNAFYAAPFSHRIDTVSVGGDVVTVTGRLAAGAGEIRLMEVRPEISLADHAGQDAAGFTLDPQPGIHDCGTVTSTPFRFDLPRMADTIDRTTSRWMLAERLPGGRWQLASPWSYATDLSGVTGSAPPRLRPRGIKGMGGVSADFPLEELVDLGVHGITVNLPISHLLDTTPHPGWPPFEHGGRTWYLNEGLLPGWDALTVFASRHDIVVSGILLIPFAETPFADLLIHPEADPAGHYAMPNFTTADGVAAYEAALEVLARRYGTAGGPHGQITNWIVHNEVGYGWEWTNMGRQPPMLYMDHYLRSLRLVHDVMRRHDPHARVFISLTHHWNVPTDTAWTCYSNRDLLERLAASSRLEGDFAWGVAYHPYPQNLRRPDAWNDSQTTDDFDTPFITPKNIAVLDRWMHRPEMRDAQGCVRGVLLSEQGFNSPDGSLESQRLQAAGFVYMWRQLRGLSSIETFHNHRWVDHPDEGGLLLGLRELPSAGRPYGDKKFAWEVYRALDTADEANATRFADALIGDR